MPAHLPRGNSGEERRLLQSVARFYSARAFGQLPEALCDHFCAARLIAVDKPGSTSVRPIAIGEVFRRNAAKCLIARYQSEATQSMAPLQVGVGIPGAAEATIHKLHQWHRSAQAGHGFLAIDYQQCVQHGGQERHVFSYR